MKLAMLYADESVNETLDWRKLGRNAGVAALTTAASLGISTDQADARPHHHANIAHAKQVNTHAISSIKPAATEPAVVRGDEVKVVWCAKVSPAFKAKLLRGCRKLRLNPDHLMACMAFESGGTFSPSVRNQAGSSGTGLIQFMAATAKGLGTSTDKLARMTPEAQLDKVFDYMSTYAGRIHTLEDMYLSILYPAAIGRNPDSAMFVRGTKEYAQNKSLDQNRDGKITPREATNGVRRLLAKGMHSAG
jgi:hypothetical protein